MKKNSPNIKIKPSASETKTSTYVFEDDPANNMKSENCSIAARNRSSNGTTYMLYMFRALKRASGLILLV